MIVFDTIWQGIRLGNFEYETIEEDQKQNKTIPDLLVATVCHRIKRKTRIRGASL